MISNIDLVCFGELLWDNLPSGRVAGGAPFNIVNRATALGLSAIVISSVGNDAHGSDLLALVHSKGNDISFIQKHNDLPTGQVYINVGPGGEPQYDIVYPVAWDDIRVDQALKNLVSSSRAFIYSSLALRDERSRKSLFELLEFAQLKICDINLRTGHYEPQTIRQMVEHADILRMNESEMAMIVSMHGWSNLEKRQQLKKLADHYYFNCVLTTLGEEGAVCYADDTWFVQPVFQVDVMDTVGAGDAFLAAFTTKYLSGSTIKECLQFGCALGALTASKYGGTPEITEEEIRDIIARS